MSNTLRRVDPRWGPGNVEFDEWNYMRRLLYLPGVTPRPVESVKDQRKDRRGPGKQGGRFGRFVNGTRNSLWNLRRKNEKGDGRDK